jgi:hypothetical protein
MMRFLFCTICFLDFSPFPLFFFDIILPRRLVVEADAHLGVANIDLPLLLLPTQHCCKCYDGSATCQNKHCCSGVATSFA